MADKLIADIVVPAGDYVVLRNKATRELVLGVTVTRTEDPDKIRVMIYDPREQV